jgi:hypothetical protein
MTTAFDNLIKYSGSTGDFKYGATSAWASRPPATRRPQIRGRPSAGPPGWPDGRLRAASTAISCRHRQPRRDDRLPPGPDYKTGPWRSDVAGMRGYKLVAGKAATADVRGDTYWGGVTYKPVTGPGHADRRRLPRQRQERRRRQGRRPDHVRGARHVRAVQAHRPVPGGGLRQGRRTASWWACRATTPGFGTTQTRRHRRHPAPLLSRSCARTAMMPP